jgi:hypothetical protein
MGEQDRTSSSQPSNILVIPTEAQRSGGICCFVGIDTHVRAAIPLPIKISTKDTATYEQPYFSFAIFCPKIACQAQEPSNPIYINNIRIEF